MNVIPKSEAIKNGLRKGFQDSSSKMAKRKCYGYDAIISDEIFMAVQREKLNRSTQSGEGRITGLRCGLGEPPCRHFPARAAA